MLPATVIDDHSSCDDHEQSIAGRLRDVGADRGSCVAGRPTALVQLFGVVAHEQQPVDVASKGDQLMRFACEEVARFARI